ncbi:acyl-CoA synthetase [Rhodococcus sp. 05-340-1]|uniref:AMP-binding protein n=1 Tax=unclassified Rhodococcus (in: high G+C Gram-positive bacteria) TaxID=192944 RepID=UPI000B9C4B98|nr:MULTISPECIES: AMP-binding protein [unclassified Rhodococcus (in: high G+C Gram-positive bacteria)]OZD66919.1 acyl-CoA synthetase [Rhodococcus sp. 05-340-2]OZD80996.1 acyl-CoA synthetase [Rhodococcus sp. 05-340-1]
MVSDVIDCSTVFAHDIEQVCGVLSAVELYPRYFPGLDYCTLREATAGYRCGVGGVEHALDLVVNRRNRPIITIEHVESGGFIRFTLTARSAGETKIDVTVFRAGLGGSYSPQPEHNRAVVEWVMGGLRRLENSLSGTSTSIVSNTGDSRSLPLAIMKTMVGTGVIRAARPDRAYRQLNSLAKWGFTLGGGFAAAAAKSPNEIALIDDRGTRTFAEIHHRSHRIAAGLHASGISPGSTVGILARNHSAMIECTVACGMLGVEVVLLNTGLAARQIETIAARHQLRVLFVDDEFDSMVRYLPDDVTRVSLSSHTAVPRRRTLEHFVAPPSATFTRPDRPGSVVVLTSGTSGSPKGAVRPTPKGFGTVAAMLSRMPLRMNERMLIAAPMFHSWGLAALQISTPLRATVVLQDRFDPEDCLRAIEAHRCTSLIAVPIMLQRILDLPDEVRSRYDTSSLRVVACSGSALTGSTVSRFMDVFGDVLYNFYGSTEVSWATIATPEDLRAAPATAGRPPLGTTVAVLDANGTAVPVGTLGRIFVGNDMLFDGYTNAEPPSTASARGAALMDTGDLGYIDCNGRLFVCGRDDEMIISGGENVFPGPVEDAIANLPQVGEVAVVGVPDPEYGQRLAAFVVGRGSAGLDADMVRAYIRNRLSRFCVPRDITFLDELPRTATGKVIKRMLIEPPTAAGM